MGGLDEVITLPTAPPALCEVVQADFDQCGSMWMSVQPEGATWRRRGGWPSTRCTNTHELRHTA